MKFDPTKPVQTRDGRSARILATDLKQKRDTIVAAITDHEELERVETFTEDGTYWGSGKFDDLDLVNIPEERECWVVFWKNGNYNSCEEEPKFSTTADQVWAIVHVKAKEGDGQ